MNVTDAIQSNLANNGNSSSVDKNESMGKDEFLRLLTVQLQHQNPLSPMKGQEFSAQLAQFSQVEQLENISSDISSSNEIDLQLTRSITNSLSTTMVGKQAKVAGNQLMVDQDGQGTVSFNLENYADEVKIKIKDSKGTTVKTMSQKGLKAGEHTLEIDDSNLNLDDEKYTFDVTASDGSKTVKASPMMIGMVNSVRFTEKGSFIILDGTEASFSSVMEVGNPE
jgi:flagellar basal-body rod modification protein FlgD